MRGRKRRFCCVAAEGEQHRPDHVDVEATAARAPGAWCSSSRKIQRCTALQPGPPCSRGQLGVAQPRSLSVRCQCDDLVLGERAAFDHLALDAGGSAASDERSHLGAKRVLLVAEAQVHRSGTDRPAGRGKPGLAALRQVDLQHQSRRRGSASRCRPRRGSGSGRGSRTSTSVTSLFDGSACSVWIDPAGS